MRRPIVLALIVLMMGTFVAIRFPAVIAAISGVSQPEERTSESATSVPTPQVEGALMSRPLRVVGMSWETVAPGWVASTATSAEEPNAFDHARIPVELAVAASTDDLAAALARGGEDLTGADIGLLPLPEFVAAYERLRALQLQIFFVVGVSDGRVGLAAVDSADLNQGGIAGKHRNNGRVDLRGSPGSSAAFFSLFVLDVVGIDPADVRMVGPEATAPFAAISAVGRRQGQDHRLRLTTADTPGLVPIVAVAPRGVIERHTQALISWAEVWLSATERLTSDVPGAARQIAARDKAPEALALIELLGTVRAATLADNARLSGLSGRGAVTLDALFQRTWRIWRAQGVLAVPAPESSPLDNSVIAAIVRKRGAGVLDHPTVFDTPAEGREDAREVLLTRRLASASEGDVVDELGFLAGVFSRARLRVAVRRNPRKARAAVTRAVERFGLSGAQVDAADFSVGRNAAGIQILAPR